MCLSHARAPSGPGQVTQTVEVGRVTQIDFAVKSVTDTQLVTAVGQPHK